MLGKTALREGQRGCGRGWWCVYPLPLCDARGKPLDGDNAHPFPDFYTYFRHYCAFYVAINSFSVALKFLKGILNTWRGATDIDVPHWEQNGCVTHAPSLNPLSPLSSIDPRVLSLFLSFECRGSVVSGKRAHVCRIEGSISRYIALALTFTP